MILMTKELEKKFKKYPFGSQDGLMEEAEVIVKYFNPCGVGTWLITGANIAFLDEDGEASEFVELQ